MHSKSLLGTNNKSAKETFSQMNSDANPMERKIRAIIFLGENFAFTNSNTSTIPIAADKKPLLFIVYKNNDISVYST